MKKKLFSTIFLTMLAAQIALANEIIVSTTADSGEGSLRAAILEANRNQGIDKIIFNIPMSDQGYLSPKITGQNGWAFFIRLEKALPEVTDGVIIDGQSQTRFTGDTNAPIPGVTSGAEVVIFYQDAMESWGQIEELTASNKAYTNQSLYIQKVEVIDSRTCALKNSITNARGGKLPLR